MFSEFIKAFGLIFIAEMGDKTQILAMAFATRYKVRFVLGGIFFGALFNHGLAVIMGNYLCRFIPVNILGIIAGFAFIGFSIWTLKIEEENGEDKNKTMSLGPVFTVATAFFIGELGDKTQLTAITLSTDASYPLIILLGTVSGMIVTGGLGIFIGRKLGNKIPEFTIKLIAASIFMIFGITKLFSTVPSSYLQSVYVILFFILVTTIFIIRVKPLLKLRAEEKASKYLKTSQMIYDYYTQLDNNIEEICLGKKYCGKCDRDKCIVGYSKSLMEQVKINNDYDTIIEFDEKFISVINDSKRDRVIEALITAIAILNNDNINEKDKDNVNKIRRNFEKILFKKSIIEFDSWTRYIEIVNNQDKKIGERLSSILCINR
ncbi:TMEM165/GDT1 family protein [Vallitalea sp.]|uniref:TMEM165/GDT1 family protein n=1 Tax=Vallitalea sp. TaxID=1882829 RepID=UPI0025E83B03|nr:TMEM165/GDT1 family protein [Vallitalea sp.]MCT4687886.1 TMEM165/GDT1 family protein [Vallitalea sp.]